MNKLTKKLSVGGCALALMMGWAFAQSQLTNNVKIETDEPLVVALSVPANATYTKKEVPLRITFENVNDEKIRLLRVFTPVELFFDLDLKTNTGTIIPVPKVAAPQVVHADDLQYLDLGAGETFGTQVDISELLPPDLKEGRYTVSLTYHNQHGESSFKGVKISNPVSIMIVDEPVTDVADGISEQKAVEIARAALNGTITIKSDEKVSVRNTAKQFIVTFGGPPPAGVRGGDFAAQVYLDRITGTVEKIKTSV